MIVNMVPEVNSFESEVAFKQKAHRTLLALLM